MEKVRVCEVCFRKSEMAICIGCDELLEMGFSVEAIREMDSEEARCIASETEK
jgi:hypothetical protein